MNYIDRINMLIQKGEAVLDTHTHLNGVIGFQTLDSDAFYAWRAQCLSFLESHLTQNHAYIREFSDNVKQGFISDVKTGMGILSSIKEDAESSNLELITFGNKSIDFIYGICNRFHLIACQIREPYNNRDTLDVQNEYDAQGLFHALLCLYFNDIRPEAWTPSYAGGAARMDFLLKQEGVVIELKKTRKGLEAREVGKQLIDDIARYQIHPDCGTLICFVYDPEGRIKNPRGIENDLSSDSEDFIVTVMIRP